MGTNRVGFAVWVVILICGLSFTNAQPVAQPENALRVEILGGESDYDIGRQSFLIESTESSRASVLWGERSVTADTVVYHEADRIIEATGEVRLWDEGFILPGSSIRYDLSKDSGELHNPIDAELGEGLYFTGGRLEFAAVLDAENISVDAPLRRREYLLYDGALASDDPSVSMQRFDFKRIVISAEPDEPAPPAPESPAVVQEPPSSETSAAETFTVEILGGQYQYEPGNKILRLQSTESSRASALWGERSVAADTIVYHEADQIIEATGDVRLWDEGFILRGRYARYDIANDRGELHDPVDAELSEGLYFTGGRLEYQWIPSGEESEDGDPVLVREYTLYDGSFTPNDLPVPHYHFDYKRIVLVPGDAIRLYNTTAVVQGWPLMFTPYYRRSLGENKITYFIELGYDSDLGGSIENRLNIELSKAYIIDLYLDFFTEAGFGKGAKFTFDVPHEYGPEGHIYAYHIDQEAPDNDNIFDGAERFLFAGEYKQKLPYKTRLAAKGHFASDSEYFDDFRNVIQSDDLDDRELERESVSHVSLTKYFDEQTIRITGAHRFDNFFFTGLPFVEREPQIHFEQFPTRILDTDLYGSFQLDYGRFRREEGITFPLDRNTLFDQTTFRDEVDRFDANFVLEHPFYLPHRFTVTPWIGYRGTYYDDPTRAVDDPSTGVRDFQEFSFDSEFRHLLQAGIEASTRRTTDLPTFLDRYDKMRMVFEPVLDYAYFNPDQALDSITSGPGVRFPFIDPVDDFRFQTHHIGAMLRTRIQGKDAAGAVSDFMRFSAGFSFDYAPDDDIAFDSFEFFDDTADNSDHRFSDLVQEFEIHPADWVSLGNSLRYDIDDGIVRSSLYYARFNPIERLKFDVGYNTFRLPILDANEQQDIVYGFQYKLSNKWEVFYRGRFDADNSVIRQNDLSFLRDMYDFFSIIGFEQTSHPNLGDDFSIRFRIGWWGLNRERKGDANLFRSPAARFF